MANILLLETATEVCSAGLSVDGKIIAFREQREGFSHSELLTVFSGQLLEEAGWGTNKLDAVCVSSGPGSYTGLRIGVSVAKGICYAMDIPLLAVSTLDTLAGHVAMTVCPTLLPPGHTVWLCPMLDARRLEVYTALYDREGMRRTPIQAQIIHQNSFSGDLENHTILFFGNGAAKCKTLITDKNALFLDGIHASARFMSSLAEDKYNKQDQEDVSCFEPFYLKDFVATVPVNKIIDKRMGHG